MIEKRCRRCASILDKTQDCRGAGFLHKCASCDKCKDLGVRPVCSRCSKCATCGEYRVKFLEDTGKLKISPCDC